MKEYDIRIGSDYYIAKVVEFLLHAILVPINLILWPFGKDISFEMESELICEECGAHVAEEDAERHMRLVHPESISDQPPN